MNDYQITDLWWQRSLHLMTTHTGNTSRVNVSKYHYHWLSNDSVKWLEIKSLDTGFQLSV
jgi:hypothetical protein